MGVEPTQDRITAPQTVLKTAPVTGPGAAPRRSHLVTAGGRGHLPCPAPVGEINEHLLDHGILGGYDLGQDYPELVNHALIAVTEMNSRDEIDSLIEALEEVSND